MSQLQLDAYIKITEDVVKSPNLCDRFSDEDLQRIGQSVSSRYESDKQSRIRWNRRNQGALELAMQVQKAKTFPWDGCSNIIFPLVTVAALQFHAKAYPAIIDGPNVVKCRTFGPNPDPIAKAIASKISAHMSWQVLEQDENWEEDTDRALLNVAIVGCGFKKTYYDPGKGHNVSVYVQAKDLVFDYWTKSIEDCQSKTHVIPLFSNDIYTRVKSGAYRDCLEESWYTAGGSPDVTETSSEDDDRDGLDRPLQDDNAPFTICEQHCWVDLDNDGYKEPYIITFEESTGYVLRIVTRFDRMEDIQRNSNNEIIRISPWEYFTKIPFIPAPDGSFMDIGFGVLLGPLNESVDAAINQLFDAGTLSNTAGGFLGRGAKIRGGLYEFAPFSWNRVDSTGDDLRKNIFPLPVREPSDVMFKLLGLILDYANRISGTTDINVGQNIGQNTPAETARTLSANGQRIYTAIFKRVWRSLKREFQKLYQLNAVYLPPTVGFGASGATIGREDYTGSASMITPVADPTVAGEDARYARAVAVKAAAAGNPAYDPDAVEIEFLHSIGITDTSSIYKGVANVPPPPPDVKLQLQEMKNQLGMAQLQAKQQQFVATMQQTMILNQAKITELAARAFKLQEEGETVRSGQQIEAFRAAMELMREQNASIDSQLKSLMEIGKDAIELGGGLGASAPISGLEGTPGDQGVVPFTGGADF